MATLTWLRSAHLSVAHDCNSLPTLPKSWMGAYALRIGLPDHLRGLLVRCRATAHGRNHSRRSCHLMMAGLSGGRRPEWYQEVITVKKKRIRVGVPRCQLVIVESRSPDLRCQKLRFTRIAQAMDGQSAACSTEVYPTFWTKDG